MHSTKSLLHVLIIFVSLSLSRTKISLSALDSYHMALSKPLEITHSSSTLNVDNYDFPDNWDTCDYIVPAQLPTNVNNQDLLILQWNTRGL